MMSLVEQPTQSSPAAEPQPDLDGAPSPQPSPAAWKNDWPPWSAPVALLAGLVIAAFAGLVIDIPAALLGVDVSSHLPAGLEIADTVVQDVAFVAAAVIFAGIGGRVVRAWQFGLRPAPRRRSIAAVVLTIVAFLTFTAIWSALVEVSTKEKLLEQLGAEKSTTLLIASAALTCVIAPISEEILFRGYFFAALSNWRGWLPAALITGVVFGGVHAGSAPIVDLVPLAALGFGLCLLYRYTRSLYPCIAAHVLNNSLAFGALEGWGWQTLLLMGIALAVVALLVRTLQRAGVITDPPLIADPPAAILIASAA
jgi:uncharacterized protein